MKLWTLLGEPVVTSLANIATDHYTVTGIPYRLAIDEGGLSFDGLARQGVGRARQRTPLADSSEEAVLFRITALLKLNFEIIIVFDGSRRPKANRKPAPNYAPERSKLLKTLANRLNILCIDAPGPAEAECARLQREQIVDAVWSDDSDTIVFGATRLFRSHVASSPDGNFTSNTHVRVTDLHDYRVTGKFHAIPTPKQLVFFTVLTGGEYDKNGLPNLGIYTAWQCLKLHKGRELAEELSRLRSESDLLHWKKGLSQVLIKHGDLIKLKQWPRRSMIEHYNEARTHTTVELGSYVRREAKPLKKFDEASLYRFLSSNFGFGDEEYAEHIVPCLLVRKLVSRTNETESFVAKYDLKIKQQPRSTEPISPEDFLVRTVKYDCHKVSNQALATITPVATTKLLDVLLRNSMGKAWTAVPPPLPTAAQLIAAAEWERGQRVTAENRKFLSTCGRTASKGKIPARPEELSRPSSVSSIEVLPPPNGHRQRLGKTTTTHPTISEAARSGVATDGAWDITKPEQGRPSDPKNNPAHVPSSTLKVQAPVNDAKSRREGRLPVVKSRRAGIARQLIAEPGAASKVAQRPKQERHCGKSNATTEDTKRQPRSPWPESSSTAAKRKWNIDAGRAIKKPRHEAKDKRDRLYHTN